MIGVIRKRDILAHPWITVQSFGWGFFWRALRADQQATFLSLLQADFATSAEVVSSGTILAACCEFELGMQQVYEELQHRFAARSEVAAFFAALADQEQEHHQLLLVCAAIPGVVRATEARITARCDRIALLHRRLEAVRQAVAAVADASAALRLVVECETTEVNNVFAEVLTATGHAFVAELEPFRSAMQSHLRFISETLARLEPALWSACASQLAAKAQELEEGARS